MKKFAFFLPQFHQIKENDEWWGEGFTEWTNVKKATPLFKDHIQPLHPLDDNYYNLLNKETVQWQTQLMKENHVDGMIYYHYYFTGKMLLEKPAENLLKWKDIDQPFFFCWANHTWNRSWEGKTTVLLKQEYGDEEDFEKHFQYLLPFFKDDRYEKKNNCPLFMLYDSTIAEKEAIYSYFNQRCIEEGFNGIYFIECVKDLASLKEIDLSSYSENHNVFLREPACVEDLYFSSNYYWLNRFKILFCKIFKKDYLRIFKGDWLLQLFLDKVDVSNPKVIHGLFFSWDNTPRHKTRGYIITSVSKKMLMKVLDKLKNQDYVFMNAWNEWAEGMILEPTKEYGYNYLNILKEWSENNDH